jgi:hypothetical protein
MHAHLLCERNEKDTNVSDDGSHIEVVPHELFDLLVVVDHRRSYDCCLVGEEE